MQPAGRVFLKRSVVTSLKSAERTEFGLAAVHSQSLDGWRSFKYMLANCHDFSDHAKTDIFKLIRPMCRAQRLINLEIPVLVRSLKSSNVELG